MADRDSAYLFGLIFKLIDDYVPDNEALKVAAKHWAISREFDFSPSQIEANETLKRLRLAKEIVDKRYPEDGPVWMYGPKYDE